MNIFEIILIGLGLSMDAACVSMSNGMCYKTKLKHIIAIGVTFGIFQGAMPLIGYFAGSLFSKQISAFDHWIALILLSLIGGKMLFDAVKGDKDDKCVSRLSLKLLLMQAVATSIDALAVGVSFAASKVNIVMAAGIIAAITCVLSVIAVYVGKKVGTRLNKKAEIFGGTILILIGLKIFIEHMFF